MDFVGIDSSRLYFSWVSASEGKKWVDVVNNVIDSVRSKGPFNGYKKLNEETELPSAITH